ncbi:hypothetical protein T05_2566 [Trichinella murrelli]|uniref:Uncharacterized protein n=1 Tax=Trichinella murrelli TaxID=144512 RepID=A0A0V0TX65_9BILA|nr:hypothetical protein T05_2566 [Trichinella murrelli]
MYALHGILYCNAIQKDEINNFVISKLSATGIYLYEMNETICEQLVCSFCVLLAPRVFTSEIAATFNVTYYKQKFPERKMPNTS